MFSAPRTPLFHSLAVLAGLGMAALAAPASATSVSVSYSANGLPAAGGVVNGLDLTGQVGQTNFTVGSGAASVSVQGWAGGKVVQGSVGGAYAAPVVNSSGATYAAPYLSTGGTPGTVTLTFSAAQRYLGFLWGSIDAGNYLNFFSNGILVGALTGAEAIATAPSFTSAGSQGFNGSQYTLVNLLPGLTFNSVVLGQIGGPSFESASYQFSTQNVSAPAAASGVPEPTSIALAAIALAGCVAFKRKA